MSAPTLIWSEVNGMAAGGVGFISDGIGTLEFASVDQPSTGPSLSASYQIAPGANSFEKYVLLKLTQVAPDTLSGFELFFGAGTIPDAASAASVSLYFGVNKAYAAPVATTSTQATVNATTAIGAANAVPFTGPINQQYAVSSYLVFQARVGAAAAQGVAQPPPGMISVEYSWS